MVDVKGIIIPVPVSRFFVTVYQRQAFHYTAQYDGITHVTEVVAFARLTAVGVFVEAIGTNYCAVDSRTWSARCGRRCNYNRDIPLVTLTLTFSHIFM